MFSYRDMTFCRYEKCKNFGPCHRSLTDAVKADADRWWGKEGAPIAVFADTPQCFEVTLTKHSKPKN